MISSVTIRKERSMAFIKYSSITNSYDSIFIEKVKTACKENGFEGPWYISEKIHGANCQMTYDEDGFHVGCRNSFDVTSNWIDLLKKYEPALKALYKLNDGQVTFYGEFFGGSYPHKEVPRNPNAKRVQKGVYYTPNNEVLFYDVLLSGKGFVDVESFIKLADLWKIPRVKFIKVSSLEEALNYPNDEPSEIYKRYNLPEIEGNIREGVVIKPATNFYAGQSRVIIKNKNDNFKEVSRKAKPVHTEEELAESTKEAVEKILCYVTEERIINCLSHFGAAPDMTCLGNLIKEANQDVLKDFENENNDFNNLDKVEIKKVTKRMSNAVAALCKQTLIKKMKGEL